MILRKNNDECRLYYGHKIDMWKVGSIVINPCAFKKDKSFMAWKMLVRRPCKKKNTEGEHI